MAAADGRLRWQAPRGCPTQQEVERSLARVESAERLSVDATVEREARGYRLRLRVEGVGQRFERELQASSCEVLAESAVFLVELAGSQLTAVGPQPGARKGSSGQASGSDTAARGRVSDAEATGRDGDRARSAGSDAAARGRAGGTDTAAAEAERGRSSVSDPAVREAEGGRTTGSDAAVSGAERGQMGVFDVASSGAGRVPGAVSGRAARGDLGEPALLSTSLPETTHRAPADSRAAAGGGENLLAETASLRLGFGAAMVEAGLSGVAPHFALDLSLALAEWSIGLRVGALLHPVLRVAEAAAVDLQTTAGQLLGCRYWDVAGVLIGPCMMVSALRTSAESTGLTGQQSSSASWLAAGPALQLQLRVVRSVLVGIEIGAWAAVTPRPSFEVAGNTVARAGTLAGYARLGAAYELW